MGNKSYFCDYCCCHMKNDINVRKKHNEGLMHKIAKTNYMRRFEDPRKVYAMESTKVPCTRYHYKGSCKFELYCQFGHYNHKQLAKLQQLATKKSKYRRKRHKTQLKSWQEMLPWQQQQQTMVKLPKTLPPSMQTIDFRRMNAKCFDHFWG